MGFWFWRLAATTAIAAAESSRLLMLILAPLAALLLQLGISRQREYQADASGAKMVGHANGLIRALEKLGAYNKRIPMDIPPSTAALCIVAPLSARANASPACSARIRRSQIASPRCGT